MPEHQSVVRRRTERSECHVVFADEMIEVWFDPNRRVAAGKFGGPSIFVLEVVDEGTEERWRTDHFGASGLDDHYHDHPEDLDDPDHHWFLNAGENSLEVALGYLERPSSLARLMDVAGKTAFARKLPEHYHGLQIAAAQIRTIMERYTHEQQAQAV